MNTVGPEAADIEREYLIDGRFFSQNNQCRVREVRIKRGSGCPMEEGFLLPGSAGDAHLRRDNPFKLKECLFD